MWNGDLRWSDDVSAAAWMAPRLTDDFGAVTRTVPSGFAAYARICHPAGDRYGRPATWTQVAQATGRQTHPLMQWHALVGSPDSLNMTGSLWSGSDPDRGNLAPAALGALCELLVDHTATAEHCFFCLWEGWGWIGDPPTSMAVFGATSDPSSPAPVTRTTPSFAAEQLNGPRVGLPQRDYLLFEGPLEAAGEIGHGLEISQGGETCHSFFPQSPNLFAPADQAWCVASEIDFDSTLVGGTSELVDAILQAPTLDSWRVEPDDSLACDADRINPVPSPSRAGTWRRASSESCGSQRSSHPQGMAIPPPVSLRSFVEAGRLVFLRLRQEWQRTRRRRN